jgi:DNA modification methylase
MDEELKKNLIELIKEGKPIPLSYKSVLFPIEEKIQEIELVYGSKERQEDILTETMSVPFQAVKKFQKVKEGEWYNKLIFGDNLQALKFMLKDPEVRYKVRLIYIDPPFGTGDLYDAAGVPAYSATLQGAAFLEFLRKRLILLRELLADDGSIYVRIDYHFGHYVKALMDEIFGKQNFQNEIIINRRKKSAQETNRYNVSTDTLFFYSKTGNYEFHKPIRKRVCSFCGSEKEPEWHIMISSGIRHPPERKIFGRIMLPPRGHHWTYSQQKIDLMIKQGRLRINEKATYIDLEGKKVRGMPEYLQTEFNPVDSSWIDLKGYTSKWNYPTENSEELLERVILASSNEVDLVLDCFAGSGTTGAVAEKLGRRWIMVDSSKLAIYTMIKRMLNLKEGIGNKGKPFKAKPFVLYNAGLYEDHGFILNIGEEEYKKFAMELFQVEPKDFEINGMSMDGVLFNCPVKVFSQRHFLTEEYIDDLHNVVGEYLNARMFIIAPASRVYFLQDYVEKNGLRYYILRIPYSIIDELHKQKFARPIQPASSDDINKLIDAVGFDFIHPPQIKANYYSLNPRDKLVEQELIIEIEDFKAVQRSKEPIEFKDPKDALSIIMLDRNYNGVYFNLTDYFFKDQIKKENWKARIPYKGIGKKIMIAYLDVLGNEAIEVKSIEDFKAR